MKLQTVVLATVLIGMLWVGSCLAGQSQAGAQCEARFDVMDTNHDGKVTLPEFQNSAINDSKAEEIFQSRDSNGDGVVTKDEMCFAKGK